MKRFILLLTFFFSISSLFSQIIFEKGYYLNNDGERIDCLIKNYEWRNNPSEIEIKNNEFDSPTNLRIDAVKEFGIENGDKYIRTVAMIDRSADQVSYLDDTREPNWSEETVFLKLIVEGESPLYYFEDVDLIRFFFDNSDKEIEQLIYKRYKVYDKKNGNEEIKNNFKFRQQLWENARIENYPSQKLKNLLYQKNDLLKYFHKLNGFDEDVAASIRSKMKY